MSRKKSSRQRRLIFESLERREMMAADFGWPSMTIPDTAPVSVASPVTPGEDLGGGAVNNSGEAEDFTAFPNSGWISMPQINQPQPNSLNETAPNPFSGIPIFSGGPSQGLVGQWPGFDDSTLDDVSPPGDHLYLDLPGGLLDAPSIAGGVAGLVKTIQICVQDVARTTTKAPYAQHAPSGLNARDSYFNSLSSAGKSSTPFTTATHSNENCSRVTGTAPPYPSSIHRSLSLVPTFAVQVLADQP